MSRQILAIDIRKEHIAAVLLSTGLKTNTITACVEQPMVPADEGQNGDPLGQSLIRLMEKINAPHANIVVSLPPDGVLFSTVQRRR